MRDDTQWLLGIIEAIDRIERYSSRGRDVFERDERVLKLDCQSSATDWRSSQIFILRHERSE
jgi:hypothetical protein